MDEITKVGRYELVNKDKVLRALDGSPNAQGVFVGGVADSDGKYDNDALLAEYDRLGGLIRLKGDKVATGSFYDFKAKKPREKADVKLEFFVNGRFVTVDAEKELPPVVKAAKLVEEESKPKKKTAKKAAVVKD